MNVPRAPERGLVSVVVAGRDCEATLGPTLESALVQTHAKIEVVYADAGSSDGSRAAAERLGHQVRVVAAPPDGTAGARNTAIEATNGQFVAFLDPGDRWAPGKIARQVALMEAHADLGLVFTRALAEEGAAAEIFPAPGAAWEALFKDGIAERDPARLYARLLLEEFVPISSVLVRRVALPISGPFNASLKHRHDHDLLLRISELKRFGFIAEPLTTIRRSPAAAAGEDAQAALEALAVLGDNVRRNPWLLGNDAAAVRARERVLLNEAGRLLVKEGRGEEARPLLKRAWRMSPLGVAAPAWLLASLAGRRPGAVRRGAGARTG